MKKIAIIITAIAMFSLSSSAQVKVVDIKRDADTLMFQFSSGTDMVNIYKNQYGYLIKEESSNMFDAVQRFYLGKDKQECITSLKKFAELYKEDVATKATVIDAMGNQFLAVTDIGMGGAKRKTTKQNSNVVRLATEDMSGWIYFRKKAMEELMSILSK
jgi:predicted P-loop ATPase